MQVLGYQRTLQAGDLWRLDETREAAYLSTKLDDSWARRSQEAAEWNAKLDSGEIKPGAFRRARWAVQASAGGKGTREALEKTWREVDGRRAPSLAWALNDTFGMSFWLGGVFKVIADTRCVLHQASLVAPLTVYSQLMGPIVIRQIIYFGTERHVAKKIGKASPDIGRGIGLAIAAFAVIIVTSVCQHQVRNSWTQLFIRPI